MSEVKEIEKAKVELDKNDLVYIYQALGQMTFQRGGSDALKKQEGIMAKLESILK